MMLRWERCPEKYRHGLKMYILEHQAPGGFLTAVLKDSLLEAHMRYDGEGIEGLLRFLYNEFPSRTSGIWGSEGAVKKWTSGCPGESCFCK